MPDMQKIGVCLACTVISALIAACIKGAGGQGPVAAWVSIGALIGFLLGITLTVPSIP